jgi:hypothetical protein
MRNVDNQKAPILQVTNPIWLWFFSHGWEDPGWGQSDAGQVAISTAIHEIASQIADEETRKQIQRAALSSLSRTVNRMASQENG